MKSIICSVLFFTGVSLSLYSQVKIGGSGSPDPGAVLELDGTQGKGLLLPRISQGQMEAMNTAPDGMMIFNTSDGALYYRHSQVWHKVNTGDNSGGFSLPYADTMSLPQGFLLSLTNAASTGGAILGAGTAGSSGVIGYSENGTALVGTSNTGSGGYFASNSGPALVTGSGNVGINTVSPASAKLVVAGTVGAVSAMFGPGTPGTALESNQPGIAFNTYYHGARKAMSSGYGAHIHLNQLNGDFTLFSSASPGLMDQPLMTVPRMLFNAAGHMGIQGNISPQAPLSFGSAYGNKIWLQGTDLDHHAGMGTQPGLMQIYTGLATDAIAFGLGSSTSFTELVRITGDGKVGIGTTAPDHPLTLHKDGLGFVQKGNVVQLGIETQGNAAIIKTLTNHALWLSVNNNNTPQLAINLAGQVGIGTHLPAAKIDAVESGSNLMRLSNSTSLAQNVETNMYWRTGIHYTGMIGTIGASSTGADLVFKTGAGLSQGSLNQQMVIKNNGDVGIGTAQPACKLEVEGKGSFQRTANDPFAIELSGGVSFKGSYNDAPIFKAFGSGNPGQTSIYLDHPSLYTPGEKYIFVQKVSNFDGTYGVRYNPAAGKYEIYTFSTVITGITQFQYMNCDGECDAVSIPVLEDSDLSDAVFNVLVFTRSN